MKLVWSICLVFMMGYVTAQQIGDKSAIYFEIENFRVSTVTGSFTGLKGDVNFDIDEPEESSFDISIPIRTIKTGIEMRDEDLREEEYFYVEKYPYARFVSTSVSGNSNQVTISGKLTVRGVTKSISIPFEITKVSGGYKLTGHITLDRYDFKVGGSGSFTMGREARLKIQCYLLN